MRAIIDEAAAAVADEFAAMENRSTVKVGREPRLARRFFDRFEPVHAVTYFSPESRAAFDGLGFRGFWMGYFAGRSAPLGVVPTEVVTALFYNFAPEPGRQGVACRMGNRLARRRRCAPARTRPSPPCGAMD